MGRRRMIDPLVQPVVTEPVRALDTVYQNTTGRPILVIAYVTCQRMGDNQRTYVLAWVDDVTPPVDCVGGAGLSRGTGVETFEMGHWPLTFVVPRNWYYQLTSIVDAPSEVTLASWFEVEL